MPLTLPSRSSVAWPPSHINTPSPSHDSHSPCATNCARRSGELTVNGNFSSGNSNGWTISRTQAGAPMIQTYNGNYAARMGQYVGPFGGLATDILYQDVCIPATAKSITLKYSWLLKTQETYTGAADRLDPEVRDSYDRTLVILPSVTNISSPKNQWVTVTRTIPTDLAGQTLRIYFKSAQGNTLPTDFWIDNVGLSVSLTSSP